jgi:PAS domain S-box-containing protein
MAKENRSTARQSLGFIALCLTIIAVLWTALVVDADRSQETAIKQARSDTSNLAIAFRENVKRTVSAIDQLMITILTENSESGDDYHIPEWVKNSPLLNGVSVQVSIADANGFTVASSLGIIGRTDLADRPHFKYHLDPTASQPFISVPVIGRNSGKWSIQITRRITRKDGGFGGVIVTSIDPFYFSQFFEAVDLGPNGVVALVGRDGIVRARRALGGQNIGQDVNGTPLFELMQKSNSGSAILHGRADGVERVYGYAAVPDYPLIVSVGLATNDVLAATRRQRNVSFAVGGVLTIVIVMLSWFFAHESRRRRQRELAAHAAKEVQEQKLLLDRALNNMHHGLLMFDSEDRAVVVNQTFIEMHRLSPETAKPGCTVRDLLEQRTASGTFDGDIDDYIEYEIGRERLVDKIVEIPDGRSIHVVNRPMDGGGWVVTHEDVTQQRKDEAAIRAYAEREQLFIAAVKSSEDAIVTKSLDGTITGWNPAAERLFGFTAQEAIGNKIDIIVPEELRDEVRAILIKIRNGQKVGHYETVRINKDGRRIEVSLSISPIRSRAGAIIGAAKVARDVGDRNRAQEALRESEQMARDIIAGSLDGFIQLDESGKVIEWNPSAESIFGWSRQDALGHRLTELFLPADCKLRHQEMGEQLRSAAVGSKLGERFEADAVRKDGRRIRVETALTALRRRRGLVFNEFVRDITEEIAAAEQLRQAQKMETVGQLTGGVAHDFNNMLTVITGTIDILAEAVADKPQLAAITTLISAAADRGAELTGQLLAFARKQPLQPRETDINGLMIEAAKLLRSALGEQIEVETIVRRDVWAALVDPSQLSSALLNLAINARDAMPEGGKLLLEASNVVFDEDYVKTNAEIEPGSYVLIAVTDTGTGIPEAIREKIFEPFFTTKDVDKGTGLGLSMVYGFVKQSGGHIKVYSEERHGTTFRIYLPRAGAPADAISAAPSAADIERGTETILVVEDDALVRSFVITQLESLGYTALSAGNAAEALAIAEGGAAFDLLFTDMIMPGKMNGKELAEAMAKRRSPLKVLFTSGYTEDAVIHHGRLDPGVLLLAKPYRKTELARMLRTAIDATDGAPACIQEPANDRLRETTIGPHYAARSRHR